jgi:hypothetical protein
MRRSLLRRSLLAAAMIALLPVPIVRAAALETGSTLDPIPAVVYRGESFQLHGSVTDGTVDQPIMEWSSDGATWELLGYGTNSTHGSWSRPQDVDANVPVGTWYLRARFPSSPGYLGSQSASQTQEVRIRQATIRRLSVENPNNDHVLVPGTNPVRVFGEPRDGAMTLEHWVDGAWNVIAGPSTDVFWVDIPALGEGQHKFRGHIPETYKNLGADRELTVTISKGPTQPTWLGSNEVQAHHTLPGKVGISGLWGGPSMDGPMTVKDLSTDAVIATGNVDMEFTIPALNVGVHPMLVTYDGNSDYAASSKTFDLHVYNDLVDARAVGRNYSTFYPVKDGYRDWVTISGNRIEPISALIRVYSPGGGVVAGTSVPIGLQNFTTCPYSATWYEGCFDHWKAIGHSPLATIWYSTSGSASINRYKHTVRGLVSAYSGTHTIYKVRVKVTYQVLK